MHALPPENEEQEASSKKSHLAHHKTNTFIADRNLNKGQGWREGERLKVITQHPREVAGSGVKCEGLD